MVTSRQPVYPVQVLLEDQDQSLCTDDSDDETMDDDTHPLTKPIVLKYDFLSIFNTFPIITGFE